MHEQYVKNMWQYVFVLLQVTTINVVALQGEGKSYWHSIDTADIQDALAARRTNNGVAKNVILFIGDGMGPTTVTSARIYGKTEQGHFSFEKFPHIANFRLTMLISWFPIPPAQRQPSILALK